MGMPRRERLQRPLLLPVLSPLHSNRWHSIQVLGQHLVKTIIHYTIDAWNTSIEIIPTLAAGGREGKKRRARNAHSNCLERILIFFFVCSSHTQKIGRVKSRGACSSKEG
jgi:hypothetical protein